MSIFEDKEFDNPTNVEIYLKSGEPISLFRIVNLSFQELEDDYIRAISINEDGKKYEQTFAKSDFVRMGESEPYTPYVGLTESRLD